jgi:hypothetical protein
MGANDRVGTTGNKTASKQAVSRYTGWVGENNVQGLSWGSVEPSLVSDCIEAVNATGDAISFARGANGAWLSLTILSGGNRYVKKAFTADEAGRIVVEATKEARA